MMSEANNLLFSPLPEWRKPWKEFVLSYAFEAVALTVIVWAGVLHPEILVPMKEYRYIGLVNTPPPLNVEPQPKRALPPPPAPKLVAKLPEVPENLKLRPLPKPQPQREVAAPQIQAPPKAMPKELERVAVAVPRKPVQTNVFSTGNSQAPTINKPIEQVQTGGFGDPNGVPAHDNHGKPVTIAQAGSYDLPGGPGYGNGTGGAQGAKGVVPSAGFGNGVAIPPDSVNPRGTVRQAGFGDSEPAAQPAKRKAEQQAKLVPAEVISKPTPAYTAEARRLHIEGEVLLQVVFEATGKLRVVRIIRGLGHGLDEAAVQAAEQIKFKPAQREGQPADSSATLHIVFQLT